MLLHPSAVFFCDFESPCSWTLSNHSTGGDWYVTSPQQHRSNRWGGQPIKDYSTGKTEGIDNNFIIIWHTIQTIAGWSFFQLINCLYNHWQSSKSCLSFNRSFSVTKAQLDSFRCFPPDQSCSAQQWATVPSSSRSLPTGTTYRKYIRFCETLWLLRHQTNSPYSQRTRNWQVRQSFSSSTINSLNFLKLEAIRKLQKFKITTVTL